MTESEPGLRALVRETVLGFIFWSVFQALAPLIWFYPLNLLEISGYEAFALMLFSPIFLGPAWFRNLIQTRWVMALLRLLLLASLASFQTPSTLSRLVTLACGCFVAMWIFTCTLWSKSRYQRSVSCWGLFLGLFAFISSRVWFTTFVPTWWDINTNSIVIAFGAIATLDKIVSGNDGLPADIVKSKALPSPAPSSVLVGLGFGSLVVLTQLVFGEVSIVTRWTVSGYPDTGPMPYPWGLAVLCALWFGIQLSPCRHVSESLVWWAVGAAAFAALLLLPTWQAFSGGVVLAVYTMSVWPMMLEKLTRCPPGRTLLLAMVTWLVQILFSVWCTAYNFVPGGVYTREHTDWLVAAIVIALGLATFTGRVPFNLPSHTAFGGGKNNKMPNTTTNALFFLILLVGVGGFASRYHKQQFEHPPKAHPKADFTSAIWTYHFGYDNQGWPSLERSAQLLEGTGADVITLLESDASKPYLGNHDLGMWLGERLGMYVDFGASTRDHTWGNLLLSKYPIVKSKHHLLPSPYGELAPGITATINMTGHLVDFVVTHMGNDRDVYDRELQAKVLASELKNAANPVVFMGYVTSAPGSRDYARLVEAGNMKDIDATDKDRWCEYIFYRGLHRLGYARVSHGGLSDTEVQTAKFRFPQDLNNFKDHDRVVTDANKADPDVRFISRFGKYSVGHNWVQEHRYHMSTPKYFIP